MADTSRIVKHMEVLGSDGLHVGTVDHLDDTRIKMTKTDSSDQHHHYVPLADVARVDQHVHLSVTAAVALATAGAAAAGGILPPVRNRAVDDSRARGNFYLPWIVGIIGLILLGLLLYRLLHHAPAAPMTTTETTQTPPVAVEAVTLPGGKTVDLAPNTLNYELQRYLASSDAAPRTFTFDRLNFDTASAAIRADDQPTVDALAQILSAYPNARVQVVGYTDVRGSTPSNAELGAQRAKAVADALVAKGVDAARIGTASGGESNPAATNATTQGQFENRRTELVVVAK